MRLGDSITSGENVDFSLTTDQKAIVDSVRWFAMDRVAPSYRERDRSGRLDRELARDMGRLGMLGAELPERFGGLGLAHLTSGLVLEAIAEADFNVAYLPLLASLCGQIISRHGEDSVAEDWLPRIVAGEAYVGLALTEPQGGSDAANLLLRARRDGDDYILDGEKTSISMADQADVVVTFARTGDPDSGARGALAGALRRIGVAARLP